MNHNQSNENPDEHFVFPFIITSLTDDRGQTQFCNNLIANIFEKRISPCKAEFPEMKIKRQIVDHYLKGICNLTQQYGIYIIEFSTPSKFNGKYVIQTDDIDIEFSKVFTEYIKNIQHQKSQRSNLIFTNQIFAMINSYLSILERTETQSTSPLKSSKHTKLRNAIAAFSAFLNTILENLTRNDVSQKAKHDLQKF